MSNFFSGSGISFIDQLLFCFNANKIAVTALDIESKLVLWVETEEIYTDNIDDFVNINTLNLKLYY